MTLRLFFALIPPREMIEAVEPVMQGVSGARWQGAAQLHITLRFVGDVTSRIADELAAKLPLAVNNVPLIAFSGVGFFEANRRPNALWLRATPRDPLSILHRKLDRICQDAGLEPEGRAYLPHMTVARLPRSAGPIEPWIESHAGFSTTPLVFARCSLVESILTENGSHYEDIAWLPLNRQ